jgi:short-chain fatty acids transporter
MQAAHSLKVHLGWIVSTYDLGEALANLVQPFWMLPILANMALSKHSGRSMLFNFR